MLVTVGFEKFKATGSQSRRKVAGALIKMVPDAQLGQGSNLTCYVATIITKEATRGVLVVCYNCAVGDQRKPCRVMQISANGIIVKMSE